MNEDHSFDSLDASKTSKLSKKSSKRYEVVIIGDSYIGKSTYLRLLAASESKNKLPVEVSQDGNQVDIWVENSVTKCIFSIKDTAGLTP